VRRLEVGDRFGGIGWDWHAKARRREGGIWELSDAAAKAAGPDVEKRMQLFISYAHLNEKEITPIKPHLTHLSQQGYIQVWQDRDLVAGEQWETGIKEALNKADLVLIFYTTAARVSKFVQETELATLPPPPANCRPPSGRNTYSC
jgi:hypothetical protein